MNVLGIDIGGTGIKGAIVNTLTGDIVSEWHCIPTPSPATPNAIATVMTQLISIFNWQGPIGCGLPATVLDGMVKSAGNIDSSWIGTDATKLFNQATALPCFLLNDADAAGIAEMRFGAGRNHQGIVIIITLGTGIGSAIFTQGKLLPNTELGHLILNDMIAEKYTSAKVREAQGLSWKHWGKRLNHYLQHLEFLFSPDLIILGGGASHKFNEYQDQLSTESEVIPAQGLNRAGIIGAALFAQANHNSKT